MAADDAIEYDEPEPLPFDANQWLGAMQLEAGRPAEAEATFRKELAEHPHNGWSLLGLPQALKAQGKPTAEADAAFEKAWARSDTWIRAVALLIGVCHLGRRLARRPQALDRPGRALRVRRRDPRRPSRGRPALAATSSSPGSPPPR